MRIVRLVRMVRMVKLYKMNGGDDEDFKMQRLKKQTPSKVGEVLSEKITRKVIMLVLVMILALPLIDGFGDTYNQFQDFGLTSLHSMASDLNCHGIKYGVNNKTTNYGNNFFIDETNLFKPMVENYAREAGRLMYLKGA